jgi:hypothetical protein
MMEKLLTKLQDHSSSLVRIRVDCRGVDMGDSGWAVHNEPPAQDDVHLSVGDCLEKF